MKYIWYGAYPFDKNLFEKELTNRGEPFKNLEDVRRQFTIHNKGNLKPKCISALWGSPNVINNVDVQLTKVSRQNDNTRILELATKARNKDYYTWKEWCKDKEFTINPDENLFEYYQIFELKRDIKILKINSWESIIKFFEKYTEIPESLFKILKDEYENYKQVTIYDVNKLKLNFVFTKDFSELKINYEKIYNEFDGMEIYHFDYQLVHSIFSTWDCDSICIWHKDYIKLLDGGKA